MGIRTYYYVGYHVRVENKEKELEESDLYLRKHCSNSECHNFNSSIETNFCADCGFSSIKSITEITENIMTGLPKEFHIRNDDYSFEIFHSDNRDSIFLIPNYTFMREKYGVLTDEFHQADITSLDIIGPFAEKFDEFRESYASLLKTLDDAGIKYNVEYGIVKYFY